MPQNFPEVWQNRVIVNLNNETANAPWLDGIAEIDTAVIEAGSGTTSEINEIHVPTTMFEPNVLINNTTYPLAVVAYTDDMITLRLDKYQPEVVTLSDDQILGASYPKIDSATKGITTAILKKKYGKAIHALAPNANTADTPVLVTTGPVNAQGRKILTYEDLVAFRDALEKAGCAMDGVRFVPSTEHYNDMLLDRKNFGDQLVDYKAGSLAPVIAGFEIYRGYLNTPFYNGTNKVPFAAVPGVNDKRASVAFATSNVAKKTGFTKQYFLEAKQNPRTQSNELGYRHYFMALPLLNKHIGAMVSGS